MARTQKKFHYIYKTTCKVNGKWYIGMHSTDDLDDGYIGSGKRLWYSINKYGRENFVVEILEFCETRELLREREAQLVTSDVIQDPLCLNLKYGGEGGFDHLKGKNSNNIGNRRRTGNYGWKKRPDPNCPIFRAKISEGQKRRFVTEPGSFTGKHHSDETKALISEKAKIHQKGERNSQYGTCWVFKGSSEKKIDKSLLQDHLNDGWSRGRRKREQVGV